MRQDIKAFEIADESRHLHAKLARTYRDLGRIADAIEQQNAARFWFQNRLALMGLEDEIPGIN